VPFDLASHLSALLAAKESLDPKHDSLVAAAQTALSTERPPSIKSEVALVQSKVAATLAVQENLVGKCSKLKARLATHMGLIDKFMAELATSEALLADARESYAASVSEQAKILANTTEAKVSAQAIPSNTPINITGCSTLQDLAKLFAALPKDHKQLLVTSLQSPEPEVAPIPSSPPPGADSFGSAPAPLLLPTMDDAEATRPMDEEADGHGLDQGPGDPKRAKVDGSGLVVSSGASVSSSTADVSGAGKAVATSSNRASPYSTTLALSTREDIRAKCREYANIVEAALGKEGS
jgi:hypothetical protein